MTDDDQGQGGGGEVVPIEEIGITDGWASGWVACCHCGFAWMAVRPVQDGSAHLECSQCGAHQSVALWGAPAVEMPEPEGLASKMIAVFQYVGGAPREPGPALAVAALADGNGIELWVDGAEGARERYALDEVLALVERMRRGEA